MKNVEDYYCGGVNNPEQQTVWELVEEGCGSMLNR